MLRISVIELNELDFSYKKITGLFQMSGVLQPYCIVCRQSSDI